MAAEKGARTAMQLRCASATGFCRVVALGRRDCVEKREGAGRKGARARFCRLARCCRARAGRACAAGGARGERRGQRRAGKRHGGEGGGARREARRDGRGRSAPSRAGRGWREAKRARSRESPQVGRGGAGALELEHVGVVELVSRSGGAAARPAILGAGMAAGRAGAARGRRRRPRRRWSRCRECRSSSIISETLNGGHVGKERYIVRSYAWWPRCAARCPRGVTINKVYSHSPKQKGAAWRVSVCDCNDGPLARDHWVCTIYNEGALKNKKKQRRAGAEWGARRSGVRRRGAAKVVGAGPC